MNLIVSENSGRNTVNQINLTVSIIPRWSPIEVFFFEMQKVGSILIQYPLHKAKFILELIWVATLLKLFTLEVMQKWQYCQLWVFRKN